ncbi:MAG: glycosyltransferase, partial [Egibacteraceae bacterium]
SGLPAAAARNAGLRRATRDVAVFVDADVELHADALTRIHDAFLADPSLTGVFGAYDDTPAVRTTVSMFRNLLHHHVHQRGAGRAETFWTGIGGLRRDAALAVGGFDDHRYPHPSIEDVELGMRLVAAGASIELDPTIQGTHLKQWTLRSMLLTDLTRRGVPWVALLLRHKRVPTTLNLGWRHRASAVASAVGLLSVARRHPAAFAGSLAVLVGLNQDLYRLLARRTGGLRMAAGIGLHALHHLVALAAVPAGVLAHMRRRPGPCDREDPTWLS